MSLLIKALDKAQAEKAKAKESVSEQSSHQPKAKSKSQEKHSINSTSASIVDQKDDVSLSLSPPEETLTADVEVKTNVDEVPAALKGSAADVAHQTVRHESARAESIASKKVDVQLALEKEPRQAQAANVFTAKQIEPSYQKTKLALVVGIVALMLLAAFFYWYQSVFNAPEIVIPPRPIVSQEMPEPLPESPVVGAESAVGDLAVAEQSTEAVNASEEKVVETLVAEETVFNEPPLNNRPKSIMANNDIAPDVEKTLTANEVVVKNADSISLANTASVDSDSGSINITQTKTESGVNPILMRAYEAYNAGSDKQAQQDYKEVLKRYGANVDAMLGLGAIATRQGRLADAQGWYRQVLEVEPRNEVATAGLISIQQQNQPQHSESSIKSMLAATPDDANLHAALGDIYASQGRWSAAQQAYFDAYRINQSAENAFNLGVSLDQLGKPQLALPYYQEALQNADQSSAIDTASLQARILSIQ